MRKLLVVFIVAAAIAIVLGRSPSHASATDLPAYAVAIDGGELVHFDTPLAIAAKPTSSVDGPLDVRVFAVRAGTAREVHGAVRVSSTGIVELRGRAADLVGDEPGDVTITIVVGREGALTSAKARAEERGSPPRGVSVGRAMLHMRP